MQDIPTTLDRLSKSRFRSGFHLDEADRAYVSSKGMETIRRHCADIVARRLAPGRIPNDGRQTPMRGHPVFKAQHATACCCRGCMAKWHGIPPGIQLDEGQQGFAVGLMMAWISREMEAPAECLTEGKKRRPHPDRPRQLQLFPTPATGSSGRKPGT